VTVEGRANALDLDQVYSVSDNGHARNLAPAGGLLVALRQSTYLETP
jgi:hypothetical protein